MSEQILSIGGLKIRYFAYNCLEIRLPTGKTLVVFDPDEEFLDAVKKYIPRPLKFEKFGRG